METHIPFAPWRPQGIPEGQDGSSFLQGVVPWRGEGEGGAVRGGEGEPVRVHGEESAGQMDGWEGEVDSTGCRKVPTRDISTHHVRVTE